MKKFTLPALFLAFMTSFYPSHGSDAILDESITSSRFSLPIVANAFQQDDNLIKEELNQIKSGISFLSLGQIPKAIEKFKEAAGEGSPLGYLYLGALTRNDNDLDIVNLAVKDHALSENILKQHVDYLVDAGFLTRS